MVLTKISKRIDREPKIVSRSYPPVLVLYSGERGRERGEKEGAARSLGLPMRLF